jgi:hypothetical protein
MRDNELIQLIRNNLLTALDGSTTFQNVDVIASNQPTQQGINFKPTVYFFKLMDHRYGFPQRSDVYDEINDVMIHTETQQYITTFQIGSLVRQNPRTPWNYTASDLTNECSAILQSEYVITQFFAADAGILKIGDINNPYFIDDKDQYEAYSSFDFSVTHKRARVSTVPVVESIQYNIKRV